MRFIEWQSTVPPALAADALWARQDYRLALYAADLGWQDVRRLSGVRATAGVADQLGRSLGSIGANIADGHGRTSSADRVRYYEHALASARETRDWYLEARHVLGVPTVRHRLRVLASVIRLLSHAIPRERDGALATRTIRSLHEPSPPGWRTHPRAVGRGEPPDPAPC